MTIYNPEFFKRDEFFDFEKMNPIFLFMLDKLRKKVGEYVNCIFTLISTNEPHHKHEKNSKHYVNCAADFVIEFNKNIIGMSNSYAVNLLWCAIEKLCFKNNCGIGVYINEKKYLSFHFDYRESHAAWQALSKNESGHWNYEKFSLFNFLDKE